MDYVEMLAALMAFVNRRVRLSFEGGDSIDGTLTTQGFDPQDRHSRHLEEHVVSLDVRDWERDPLSLMALDLRESEHDTADWLEPGRALEVRGHDRKTGEAFVMRLALLDD